VKLDVFSLSRTTAEPPSRRALRLQGLLGPAVAGIALGGGLLGSLLTVPALLGAAGLASVAGGALFLLHQRRWRALRRRVRRAWPGTFDLPMGDVVSVERRATWLRGLLTRAAIPVLVLALSWITIEPLWDRGWREAIVLACGLAASAALVGGEMRRRIAVLEPFVARIAQTQLRALSDANPAAPQASKPIA
jgi:hypothetical protein